MLTACTGGIKQSGQEDQIQVTGKLAVTPEEKRLYREAITALNANELDAAEDLLQEFRQKKPQFAGPLANLGLVYFKQGKLEQARTILQEALKKNPKQPHALNLLGQIAYLEGHATEAENLYLKAIASKKDYANAHYNLALLYDIFFQDIAKAVKHYQYYMQLTKFSDKETADWVEQLKNSLKGG